MITASIVIYNNNSDDIQNVINSFFNTALNVKLFVIDNSETDRLKQYFERPNIEYFFNNKNIGFGAAHNIGIKKALECNSFYHIILNPDVYFDAGVMEKIVGFMDNNNEVGLTLPKVLYPDGSLQYLVKLLPGPLELILRRFITIKSILKMIDNRYELRDADYNKSFDAPYLSGCFMFCRTEVLKKIGGFDERFFMYMEDVDLSRRINEISRTVYFSDASIYHKFTKGSHKSKRLLSYHIISAFSYFNKWGWFLDRNRSKINRQTLENIKTK